MLFTRKARISSDRIYRFISEKRIDKQNRILLGDFVFMKFEQSELIVQCLGFKFLDGKPNFHGESCPIKKDERERSVAVLCCFFHAEDRVISTVNRAQRYVSVDNYIRHANVKRDLKTGSLSIK